MLPLLIISTKITLLLPVPVTTKIIIYIFIYYCLPELKQVFFFLPGNSNSQTHLRETMSVLSPL